MSIKSGEKTLKPKNAGIIEFINKKYKFKNFIKLIKYNQKHYTYTLNEAERVKKNLDIMISDYINIK